VYNETGAGPEQEENNMKTTITIKPAFQDRGNWVEGEVKTEKGATYSFWAKVFETGSEFGINEGCISKLTIRRASEKKDLVNYDRGWDIEPNGKEVKAVYESILTQFN
jgi:hypothetical protein